MIATQPAARRELPIAFMPRLVPLVLDGTKTQTRRVPRLPYANEPSVMVRPRLTGPTELTCSCYHLSDTVPVIETVRPRWAVGDFLWVKEALYRDGLAHVHYVAGGIAERSGRKFDWPWKVNKLGAMYCPRWASRATLEVLGVGFERLQEITEADARAEGVANVAEFRTIWIELHGRESWDANGFVTVTDFRRVRP